MSDPLEAIFTVHGGVEEAELECCVFSDVCFARDFGPWKAGQSAHRICVVWPNGLIEEYDINGRTVASCRFRLEPNA